MWEHILGTYYSVPYVPICLFAYSDKYQICNYPKDYVDGIVPSTLNSWDHIAITALNGLITIFVNGVQANQYTVTNSSIDLSSIDIGYPSKSTTGLSTLTAYISNIAIFNEVLWQSNFVPPLGLLPQSNKLYVAENGEVWGMV